MKKKLLLIMLSAMMVLTMMPSMAFAEVAATDVCKIGNTGYATLAEAFAAATGGTAANPVKIKVLASTLDSFVLTTSPNAQIAEDLDTTENIKNANYNQIPDYVVLEAADNGTKIKGIVELNGADHFTMTGFSFDASFAKRAITWHHSGETGYNGTTAQEKEYVSSIVDNNQQNCPKGYDGNKTNNGGASFITIKDCTFEASSNVNSQYIPIWVYDQGKPGDKSYGWDIEDCEFLSNALGFIDLQYLKAPSTDVAAITIKGNTFGTKNYVSVHDGNPVTTGSSVCKTIVKDNTFNGDWTVPGKALSVGSAEGTANYTITGNTFNYTGTNLDTLTLSVKNADKAYINGNTVAANQLNANQVAAIADANINVGVGEITAKKRLQYKYQKTVYVAQIGDKKYTTLAKAIADATAVQGRSATNRVTIDIIGECESISSGADIQYVTFKGHDGGSMNGYQASTNAKLKGTHFEDVAFNGTFQIQACNNTNDDDIVVSGCTFNGASEKANAIQIQRYETTTVNNLVISGNTFKNYTAAAIIANLSDKTSLDDGLVVTGNTFDSIGHNAVQALKFSNVVISGNTCTNMAANVFNVASSEGVTITGNTISLADGKYAVNNVTGMTYMSNNTLKDGSNIITDISRNADVSDGGIAAVDAYIVDKKVAGGIAIKKSGVVPAAKELATGCNAVKIADTLYLVGLGASGENLKITGGKFVENPLAYVADDYGVKASGNTEYPYEVYKITPAAPEQKQIVVEQVTETKTGEDIKPAEKETATKVLDKVEVTGVADALTDAGQNKIIEEAKKTNKDLPAAITTAKQVDIDITVEATAVDVQTTTAAKEADKVLVFELTPYAVVTAISKTGEEVKTVSSEKVLVENDYLSKNKNEPIKVVLGTTFKPEQVLHYRHTGEIEAYTDSNGKEPSYVERTYKYSEPNETQAATVSLYVLDFSEVKLLATAEPEYNVSFDANGGSGTMNPEKVVKGSKYFLPANGFTAPSGKEFKAWQVGEKEYAPQAELTITEDTSVKAVWKDSTTPGGGSTDKDKTSGTTTDKTKSGKGTKTGDENNLLLYFGLFDLMMLGIAAILFVRVKGQKK